MQSIIFDNTPSYRNQHYIIANTANGSSQHLSCSFTPVQANSCFWGSLWVRASSFPTNIPVRVATFSETSASGVQSLGVTLIITAAAEMTVRLSRAPITVSGGVGTESYQLNTGIIQGTLNGWHKIQFFFNSAATDVNDNLIIYDNVPQTLTVRTGAPAATALNMSYCRIMHENIPAGFRLANVWLSCGTNTKAAVEGYRLGVRSPLWLGDKGLYGIDKPVIMYMHGTKNVIQNSVNKQNFTAVGAAFTSLVKAPTGSDQVIL